MQFHIRTGPILGPEKPLYLIAPVPPTTAEQSFTGLESTAGQVLAEIKADNGPQKAYLFEVPAQGVADFTYHMRPGCGCIPMEQFEPVVSPLTAPSDSLSDYARRLTADHDNPADKLRALIDFTASMFDYDHPERPFYYGQDRIPLLMELTKGNCADIHGFLLSCIYSIGLNGAYYSGFFFPDGERKVEGFHCWLASMQDEQISYWDVSQFIKHDISPVRAGLNPIGGRRIALGCGRGLVFDIDGMKVRFNHFGHPMWVYPNATASGPDALAAIGEAAVQN